MTDVFLALGSNLAPRSGYINQAIQRLSFLGSIPRISPLYESAPYGETDQPAFINTAVVLQTQLSPQELLTAIKQIEESLGRKPRYRWGPREIDIDIIFYDGEIIDEPGLRIPHTDYHNRRFVLQPLTDLAPDFTAPDTGKSLRKMLAMCPDTTPLTKL